MENSDAVTDIDYTLAVQADEELDALPHTVAVQSLDFDQPRPAGCHRSETLCGLSGIQCR